MTAASYRNPNTCPDCEALILDDSPGQLAQEMEMELGTPPTDRPSKPISPDSEDARNAIAGSGRASTAAN